MIAQSIKKHRTWLVSAAILATLAGVFVARTAFARIAMNTIDPVAIVTHKGRHIDLTGPIEVLPAGERVLMRVTVTQRTTGAVAEGVAWFIGTGESQQWEVRARTLGRQAFEEGPATAVGLAQTITRGGHATDAHQWLVNITLVKE